MRNPGCTPVDLPRLTIQPSSEIDGDAIRAAHDLVGRQSAACPMRLVNQLESGTSSTVLTFSARTSWRSPGSANVLTTKS